MDLKNSFLVKIFGHTPILSPNRYAGLSTLASVLSGLRRQKLSIIDIGSGSTSTFNFLAALGIKGEYLGIDLEFKDDSLGKIIKKAQLKAYYKKADILKFKSKKKFDIVFSLWNLEHINNHHLALKKMSQLLKKSGKLILIVPSVWTWPVELGRHGYHYYSGQHLKELVNANDLNIDKLDGVGGVFGLIYTIIYQWISYLVLIPTLLLFKLLNILPDRETKKDIGSAALSRRILRNTIFLHTKTEIGRKTQLRLVRLISFLDKYFPFTPLSYLIVANR